MEKKEIVEIIKTILVNEVKLTPNKDSIQEDSNLKNEFNINSMQMVTFLVELEEYFNIEMDNEEITQDMIVNIRLLTDFIKKQL